MAKNGQLSSRVPSRVTDSAGRLRDQSSVFAHTVAEEAAELAAAGTVFARDVGGALAERAKQNLPEVRDRVPIDRKAVAKTAQAVGHQMADAAQAGSERARATGTRVSTEVVPALRDLATQAAALAIEQWEHARTRSGDASGKAASLVRDRSGATDGAADEIIERARRAADEVLRGARHSADEILARARAAAAGAAGETAERAGQAAEPVVQRAKAARAQAGEDVRLASRKAAETGNNTLGFIAWSATAAGIVWYVLLDRERREQLTRFAQSVWTQGSELYRDIKGEDEAF